MIAIVDYRAGNLTSVLRAVQRLRHDAEITDDAARIAKADRVIFPGVGAAGEAMANLRTLGLDQVLREEVFKAGKPMLGICIGVQIIFEQSEENQTECLGLLPGTVRRFPNTRGLKVPQIGWNAVHFVKPHPITKSIPDGGEFYFVNSYYPAPSDSKMVVARTGYGIEFASIVACNNLVATQFHLEKSGEIGLRMLDNFCAWDGRL